MALAAPPTYGDALSTALHIYDVATHADRVVTLPYAPVAVDVDATGLSAAVAYDSYVSLIDLEAAVVKTTCSLTSNAAHVALSSAGVAYVMPENAPADGNWPALQAVDFSSCAETLGQSSFVPASYVGVSPNQGAVFVFDDGQPSKAYWCDPSSSPFACQPVPTSGVLSFGASFWFGSNGTRIYTDDGVAVDVPADLFLYPFTYAGTLNTATVVLSVSDAPQAQRVVSVQEDDVGPVTGGAIHVYDSKSFALVARYQPPSYPYPVDAGTFSSTTGVFVFTTPTMDAIYVVERANWNVGNGCAIATITP